MTLAKLTKKTTAYTQQPSPANLVSIFNVEPGQPHHKHPAGFDLMLQQEAAGVPMTARATLPLDRLGAPYEKALFNPSHDSQKMIDYLLPHTDPIHFLCTSEPQKLEE